MNIFNELPTGFTWYDQKAKQHRYRENAAKVCDYKLISPNNALLPFELKSEAQLQKPVKWRLVSACEGAEIDVSININQLKASTTSEGTYIYYKGGAMTFKPGAAAAVPLAIPEGAYYSVLTFPDESEMFSELFTVVPDLSKYMKIEWWNPTDIAPIFYNGGDFKQAVYLDTFVHVMEPEIEQDGERDLADQLIPTFSKMVVKYRFTVMVPDYMKIAITSMQIHDEVFLTTNTRTGKIESMSTTSTVETNGAYSTVDVILEQLLMVKDSCNQNMEIINANPWGA